MRHALMVLALFAVAFVAPRQAQAQRKKPAETKAAPSTTAATPTTAKVKTYDFGGLNVDGRMKTPQLLYFLNRMQAEFDQTTLDKRSFMPELKRSADDL